MPVVTFNLKKFKPANMPRYVQIPGVSCPLFFNTWHDSAFLLDGKKRLRPTLELWDQIPSSVGTGKTLVCFWFLCHFWFLFSYLLMEKHFLFRHIRLPVLTSRDNVISCWQGSSVTLFSLLSCLGGSRFYLAIKLPLSTYEMSPFLSFRSFK